MSDFSETIRSLDGSGGFKPNEMSGKRTSSASSAFRRITAKTSIIASLTSGNVDQLRKKSKYGRTPKSTLDRRGEDGSIIDPEHELHRQLYEPMRECSRQRLRSLQMGLRKYANIDSRITVKELQQVFQDSHVKVPSRLFQMLVETFEDSMGIDYERLYMTMVEAQSRTGRDSVMAQHTKNDVENQRVMSHEEKDADLVRRLEKVLTKAGGKKNKYDLTPMRNAFQARDKNKAGLLKKSEIETVCSQLNVPVYGALLNGLLNRCDDEGMGDVSWPEVMSFLEKAQLNLDNAHNQDKMSILSGRPMSVLSLDSSTSSGSNSSKSSNKKGAKGRGAFRGRAGQKGNKQQQGKDKAGHKDKDKGGKKANIIEEHPDEDEDDDDEDEETKLLGKTLALMKKQPKTAEDYVRSAFRKQTPQTPTEVNPVLQKTVSLMTKQPKSADDYVKTAFRKVPQTPTEDLKGNASLQKTLLLMSKQQKNADDYVKSAFRKQIPQTPTEDIKGNPALQKTLALMTNQPRNANDLVKSAFRKQSPQAPAEESKGSSVLQKTLSLMTNKPKNADDYVKSAFRKQQQQQPPPEVMDEKDRAKLKKAVMFMTEKDKTAKDYVRSAFRKKPAEPEPQRPLIQRGNKPEHQPIPVIQVEKSPDEITHAPSNAGSTVSSPKAVPKSPKSPRSPRGRPSLKAIDMDVKGNKLTFYPPDSYNDNMVNTDPPQLRLKLEWVYGYRGNDCRSNIYVLNSGEIIYFIGTVVVMYIRETHKQRHYKEHTQEIRCMALHPNGITVATGQGAYVPQNAGEKIDNDEKAHIRLWRADTLQTQHVIGTDFFTKNVITLAFSKSKTEMQTAFVERGSSASRPKERLLAVDMAPGHNLSVWDTGTGKLLAKTNLKVEVMCDAAFQPTNPDVVVTIGKEHLAWWNIYPEQQAIQMQCKADYDNFLRAKYVICMLHNERGDLVTGDSNGTVYVWGNGGNTITNFIKHGHDGPVFSLAFSRSCLLTSGRDGIVNSWIWSKNMDKSGEISIPQQEGGVRMIQIHKDHLLIGTTTNSILTAQLSATALKNPLAGVELNEVPLTQGHFDVLAGLAIVRSSEHNSQILTAGTDGIVCMFDCQKKQPLWKYMLRSTSAVCVDVSVAGTLIAMGTRDSVLVLQVDQHDEEDEEEGLFLQQICHHKVTGERLTTIKLNNECTVIAAGDTSGAIHLVKWKQDESGQFLWEFAGSLTGHEGAITSIDWSSEKVGDEFILRSTSSNTELFFWDISKKAKLQDPENVRNIKWLTEHCLLNYSVAGVWHSKQAKDGEVCTVDVNLKNKLVAMGNSRGYLSLFRHPCSKPGAYSHTYRAHPIVYNLSFTRDGRKLISVGGPDSCIMQWHVL